jgi:hypothetical protein
VRPPLRMRSAIAVAGLCLVATGCGYIVTPADESSPTPAVAAGSWVAEATKVAPSADGGVHVDLALTNETGSWSSMAAKAGAVQLVDGSGAKTGCDTAFVGTGGTSLAPGFRMRGYTGGSKTAPKTQLLYVECAGVAPAAGQKLAIDYTYTAGDFNYYRPAAPAPGTLSVDLDKVAGDLTYPVAEVVPGTVEAINTPITAINKVTLTLTAATRKGETLSLDWETQNPTKYPVYVHIGTPPAIGSDGVLYGFYESPHLADTPLTPAGGKADWTTTVTVPADVTGLYVLASVESKQQKNFSGHAIDITSQ